ncbi:MULTISPECIES: hypothetical protein [unclassified Streptomyces]|uniref:hypothetical protein n=1 Tax=unclassified Streptomyces TaxID=2593676 RepID=UPI002DDB6F90|nr:MULTISPECIES: hypothetical protein [unclassified Streptomyces]WSA95696.1 hypothetical protein OIE63_32155 [Streptomyces sp. NBC_01795]WSB80116.1 hypothetical protein OHB04_33275 [Streptomyces sp. NBC_01775]WSS11677.1 hypothetical protein OG533_06940 [Streptomyces sp. NBC_01186]WSS40390.1 hypothetical protein OG220_07085 [Streptomyces sp. NBC_01187]
MTAPAHLTSDQSGKRTSAGGVQTRLPWWGLLLPALGFALLMVLLVGGGQAGAATHRDQSPVLAFFAQVRDILLG